MEALEIKRECNKIYAEINLSEKRLHELRSICKHENIFEGNYSWRIGVIGLAEMCDDCGKLIRYK